MPALPALGCSWLGHPGCGPGATPEVAACLRSLPAQALLNVQGTMTHNGPCQTPFTMADGTIPSPQGVFAALKAGQFAHMPVLSGFVHDEATFFSAPQMHLSGQPISKSNVTSYASPTCGANAGKVLNAFKPGSYPTPQLALNAIGTPFFVCPRCAINQALSSQVPVHAYQFNDRTAPFHHPPPPNHQSLAYRTGDVQYLLPLLHGGPNGIPHPLNIQQKQLSIELVAFWSNFAWAGNPNLFGNWPWPRYDARRPWSSYYLSENIPALSWVKDTQVSAETSATSSQACSSIEESGHAF